MASPVLYAALFVSGFTALLYEIVWQRLLVRITGATMPATVATFSLFMLGLALGSFFSIKYCEKHRRPLKIYAIAEALVALSGLLILYLCEQSSIEACSAALSEILSSDAFRSYLVLAFWGLAGLIITVATIAMSVAFNCGLRALQMIEIERSNTTSQLHSVGTSAYRFNLAGATIGSIAAAFFCLPLFGLTNTGLIAVALSIALAVTFFSTRFKSNQPDLIEKNDTETTDIPPPEFLVAFALIFVFSFVSMSLEIAWTRLLCLVCGSSTYAVGSVLAAVLVSLLLGAISARRASGKKSLPFMLLSGIAGGAALILAIDLFALPYLTWSILLMQHAMSELGCSTELQFFVPRVLLAFGLICASMFLIGLVTPVLIQHLSQAKNTVKSTACALTASTSGSIVGALAVTCLVIPNDGFASGIEISLISAICMLSMLGVVCLKSARVSLSNRNLQFGSVLIVSTLGLLALHPRWQPGLMALGPSFVTVASNSFLSFQQFKDRLRAANNCLFYKEGSSATITVEANEKANVIYLKSNGKVESALPLDWHKAAPTSDYRTQLFLGILPIIYFGHEARDLKALSIGFGSGITSALLLSFEQISQLTTCEIEPAVFKAEHFFDSSNFQPLRSEWLTDGRFKPECADARAYLNKNGALFDIVISQPSEPWISGSSDLFTMQFFRLAKAHLKREGVFVQWLQLYCIDEQLLANLIATFERVFPETYVLHPRNSGDLILIGATKNSLRTDFFQKLVGSDLSKSGLSKQVFETLKSAMPESEPILDCDFILTPDDVLAYVKSHKNISLNTDGRVATEYQLPQELGLNEEHINQNILGLKTLRAK